MGSEISVLAQEVNTDRTEPMQDLKTPQLQGFRGQVMGSFRLSWARTLAETTMGGSTARRGKTALAAGLLLAGLLVQVPQLAAPLLEGAAGKQAHTAMIARNLATGRAVFSRPLVDDMGNPGYFIKEIPLIPQAAAWLSEAAQLSIDTSGRLLGLLAWLVASGIFFGALVRAIPQEKALIALFWSLFSPLAFAYAPAFQNDTTAIAVSLGAWAVLLAWRKKPRLSTALVAGLLTALSLLLKPHIVFWLAPAAAVIVFAGENRPPLRHWWPLALFGIAGGLLASVWYLHAASIHRAFPTPGATVATGWVDASLLLTSHFWVEMARQLGLMVFTPVGAGLALIGLTRSSGRNLTEWSLLAWGCGVLVQDLVFATRFIDDLSYGTEYYQLALVPVAGLLISDGILQLRDHATRFGPLIVGLALLALGTSSPLLAREARTPPARYEKLREDCARVRTLSSPTDSFLVFADRSGTILYYCERRGTTFTLGSTGDRSRTDSLPVVSRSQIDRALRQAEFAYFPFPNLVEDPEFLMNFERKWQELDMSPSKARLFRRGRGR